MKFKIIISFFLLLSASTVWSFNLSPQPIPFSVSNVSFTMNGKLHRISEYKGRKVMLWMFSTWCHTCIASIRKMQRYQAILKKTDMLILAIRNFNNGGVAGLLMPDFIQKIKPRIKDYKNWKLGEASAEMDKTLNAKKFPDIYFLIDAQGAVKKVDTAPNIHMQSIIKFAQQHSK